MSGQIIGPLRVWLLNTDIPGRILFLTIKGLAMTRSFGDKIGMQAGVVAEPGIYEIIYFPRISGYSNRKR